MERIATTIPELLLELGGIAIFENGYGIKINTSVLLNTLHLLIVIIKTSIDSVK